MERYNRLYKIFRGLPELLCRKNAQKINGYGARKYKKPFNKVIFHLDSVFKHDFSRLNKKGKLIFVNSMSDTFHKDISDNEIKVILDECEWNDPHTFQILTKRAERLPDFIYPDNVWLGVTVEMAKYKHRINYLKQTNAKVKFLSCEPLLEDLGELDLSGIDWVIAGGESGAKARPMHPDWVRNIQRQCETQKVPFFFKQWGEWKQGKLIDEDFAHKHFCTGVFREKTVILNVPFDETAGCYKIGKKYAGCLLDGKEYKEMPKGIRAV